MSLPTNGGNETAMGPLVGHMIVECLQESDPHLSTLCKFSELARVPGTVIVWSIMGNWGGAKRMPLLESCKTLGPPFRDHTPAFLQVKTFCDN